MGTLRRRRRIGKPFLLRPPLCSAPASDLCRSLLLLLIPAPQRLRTHKHTELTHIHTHTITPHNLFLPHFHSTIFPCNGLIFLSYRTAPKKSTPENMPRPGARYVFARRSHTTMNTPLWVDELPHSRRHYPYLEFFLAPETTRCMGRNAVEMVHFIEQQGAKTQNIALAGVLRYRGLAKEIGFLTR